MANNHRFTREQLTECGLDKIYTLDNSVISIEISLDLMPEAYYKEWEYKFDIPAIYKVIGLPMPIAVVFGSDEYWSVIPEHINAVSLDSRGNVKYWKENYGCYSDYVDNGGNHRDGSIGRSQHWYYSSLHKETDAPEIKTLVDYKDKIRGRGAICEYRPGLPKKILDLNDIDWSLIPTWANQIIVAVRPRGTDIQCVASGHIDNYGNIQSPYELSNNTRPSTRLNDICKYNEYNYDIINVPTANTIYTRPKIIE